MSSEWVAFDFDGTLCLDDGTFEGAGLNPHLGPIVMKLLAEKITVKILTARASKPDSKQYVEEWSERYFGQKLEVTDAKDHNMLCLFDDRAISTERNGPIIADITRMRQRIQDMFKHIKIQGGV